MQVVKSETLTQVETLMEALKQAQAAHNATLPVMPAAELEKVVIVTQLLDVSAAQAKGAKDAKANYRMTEEHKDQIAAAKAQHRILVNTPEVRERLQSDIKSGYIKAAQRKLRADGRTVVTIKAVV